MLTKPGKPLPGPLYIFAVLVIEQARKTARPTPELWEEATITSK
ncbi:MAG: hypothetical protein ACOYZ8_06670 [Chloroflexota bacterium]